MKKQRKGCDLSINVWRKEGKMSHSISTGKDDFYRQSFTLASPSIIQNLLSAAVNSAYVIMLNYVGLT